MVLPRLLLCGLCALCVTSSASADLSPILSWDVEVSRLATYKIELRRGETVILQPNFTEYAAAKDLTGATAVTLRYRSSDMTGTYYAVTGSVHSATGGLARIRTDGTWPTNASYSYEISVASSTAVLCRAYGTLSIATSIGYESTVVPVPVSNYVLRAVYDAGTNDFWAAIALKLGISDWAAWTNTLGYMAYVADAPVNTNFYARRSNAWEIITSTAGTSGSATNVSLADLTDTMTLDNIPIGDGTNLTLRTPAQARTALGLGTAATNAAAAFATAAQGTMADSAVLTDGSRSMAATLKLGTNAITEASGISLTGDSIIGTTDPRHVLQLQGGGTTGPAIVLTPLEESGAGNIDMYFGQTNAALWRLYGWDAGLADWVLRWQMDSTGTVNLQGNAMTNTILRGTKAGGKLPDLGTMADVNDAASDGTAYLRRNAGWSSLTAADIDIAGGLTNAAAFDTNGAAAQAVGVYSNAVSDSIARANAALTNVYCVYSGGSSDMDSSSAWQNGRIPTNNDIAVFGNETGPWPTTTPLTGTCHAALSIVRGAISIGGGTFNGNIMCRDSGNVDATCTVKGWVLYDSTWGGAKPIMPLHTFSVGSVVASNLSGVLSATNIASPPWATNTPAGIAAAGGLTNPAAFDAAGSAAAVSNALSSGAALGATALQPTNAYDLSLGTNAPAEWTAGGGNWWTNPPSAQPDFGGYGPTNIGPSDSYIVPTTLTSAATVTITRANGNMCQLTVTNSPCVVTFSTSDWSDSGAGMVGLSLYIGTNTTTLTNSLVSFATAPTLATNAWNFLVYLKKQGTNLWAGRQ
jgi:hypothetical protein